MFYRGLVDYKSVIRSKIEKIQGHLKGLWCDSASLKGKTLVLKYITGETLAQPESMGV